MQVTANDNQLKEEISFPFQKKKIKISVIFSTGLAKEGPQLVAHTHLFVFVL